MANKFLEIMKILIDKISQNPLTPPTIQSLWVLAIDLALLLHDWWFIAVVILYFYVISKNYFNDYFIKVLLVIIPVFYFWVTRTQIADGTVERLLGELQEESNYFKHPI